MSTINESKYSIEYIESSYNKLVNQEKEIELKDIFNKSNEAKEIFNIGQFYFFGHTVKKNMTKAVELFHISAEKGFVKAITKLGYCHLMGIGITQDFNLAFNYYKLAAESNFEKALIGLAMCYAKGIGVTKNIDAAILYYKKAGKMGDNNAYRELIKLYNEIKYDKKEIFKIGKILAKEGDIWSTYELGRFYYMGVGTKHKPLKAIKIFNLLIAKEDIPDEYYLASLNNLGLIYFYGHGIERNFEEAFKYFKTASDKGYMASMKMLSHCYHCGHGVEKDYKKAFDIYTILAEKEDHKSICNLGFYYKHGYGTEKNLVESYKFFKIAAEKGCVEAANQLKDIIYKELNDSSGIVIEALQKLKDSPVEGPASKKAKKSPDSE